jgi:hypothetical protein
LALLLSFLPINENGLELKYSNINHKRLMYAALIFGEKTDNYRAIRIISRFLQLSKKDDRFHLAKAAGGNRSCFNFFTKTYKVSKTL